VRCVGLIGVIGLGAGCSDHYFLTAPDLASAPDLAIVAHEDDDLLFMQPDLMEKVQAATGVTILYITAGDDGHNLAYIEDRQFGVMSGYGTVANDALADWRCGWLQLADHPAQHCRLADANLSLVFLGYPDGGVEGQFENSLLSMWKGETTSAATKSRQPSTYTQDELIAAVAQVIQQTNPTTLRTLDVESTHGHDHEDHMIVGALALLADARSGVAPRILTYRGYNIASEIPVKPAAFVAPQLTALEAYDACATQCDAACGGVCSSTVTSHIQWASRRLAIGFRTEMTGVTIASADGSGCVAIGEDAMATLVDCATAPAWQLTSGGVLATAGSAGGFNCLDALPTGELTGDACDPSTDGPGGVGQRMFVDDDGHVWGSLVPVPAMDMAFEHLDCMVSSGGRPRLVLCGGSAAPTWTFERGSAVASSLGIPAASRPVLADLDGDGYAELVYDDGVRLIAAHGLGDGTFGSAAVLATLAIAPDSLTAADLDGDGLADFCGHAAGGDGVACAFSTTGYQSAADWSPALSPLSPVDGAGDVSLAAVFGELCAVVGSTSLDCSGRGSGSATKLSSEPPPGALVWFAPVGGGPFADWCTATSYGVGCGLRYEAELTTAPVPWSFSFGSAEVPTLSASATAIADIDGDGFPDLCGVAGNRVTCARGQGRGFGPTTPLAQIAGSAGDHIVLGDIDGDGHADTCVATADGVLTCQLSP
jgi:LmbE family N-acetylglucosaminyl deacetylase